MRELVTKEILRGTGLNAQAFSGSQNPSTIYQAMGQGTASVFPYYREVEEKDTAIASALSTRRLLVLAREANVQSADAENKQAQRYADELAGFLDAIPKFDFALWELLDAPAYGYSVAEILWEANPLRVVKILGRPQELFRFGKTFEPQTGEMLLSNFAGADGAPVPPAKFIVSTYQPRHGDRRGIPLLRRLFWSSWFKRNVLRMHLKFLEKGSGTVVVKHGAAAGPDEKAAALNAAQVIADEIAAAVPQGFELMSEALQTTRIRQAEDFRQLADYMDAEMTRMILGQTLSSRGAEQGAGSRALGEVHIETLHEYIRSDAGDLETAINEQLCAPWLLWTFGPQALDRALRPWWTIDKQPPRDAAKAADLLSKARALSLEIPESYAREKLEIPAPEEGEAVLAPPFMPIELTGLGPQ